MLFDVFNLEGTVLELVLADDVLHESSLARLHDHPVYGLRAQPRLLKEEGNSISAVDCKKSKHSVLEE
jgi:hypothetical protein